MPHPERQKCSSSSLVKTRSGVIFCKNCPPAQDMQWHRIVLDGQKKVPVYSGVRKTMRPAMQRYLKKLTAMIRHMSLIANAKTFAEGLVIKAISEPRLFTVQLDITNACNLSCSHCYHPHHRNTGALSLKDWETILEKIESFMRKYQLQPRFMFCGGEPLLSPFLKPLINRISEKWPDAELIFLTNGTIIKDSLFDTLSATKASFQISLDGPDGMRHDFVRGPGSFKKSLAGIDKILTQGYQVAVLSILSQRTAPWIPEYFDLAKNIGVNAQNFTRLIAEGHGKQLVDDGVDFPLAGFELKDAFTTILLESFRTGIATNTNQPLFSLLNESFGQHGLFGFDSLIIDYQGNLKVTSRTKVILGNVLTDNLENIYIASPILRDIRRGKIDVCGSCNLYSSCGGDRNAAYAEYGTYTARDPGCWK